jgi:hypothetical protein
MNQDGDLDMLLGRDDGSLCLVENIGTPQNPLWGPIQRGYLGYQPVSYGCKPAVGDVNGSGVPDVLVVRGDQPPRLYRDPLYNLTYRDVPDTLLYQNNPLGRADRLPANYWFAPSLTDVTGDGKPDLTWGSGRGGIHFLENRTGTLLSTQPKARPLLGAILGNPSTTISLQVTKAATVHVYDMVGKQLYSGQLSKGHHQMLLAAPTSGVYRVDIQTHTEHQSLRWVAQP